MADIQEELRLLAKNTPAILPFLRKFQEYLKSGIEIVREQYSYCSDFAEVRRLCGEEEGYQKIIGFLEELIRPPKLEGDNEKGEE